MEAIFGSEIWVLFPTRGSFSVRTIWSCAHSKLQNLGVYMYTKAFREYRRHTAECARQKLFSCLR